MSFRSIPSSRYGGGGLDQVGLFCYGEGRYWWICAPRVILVSRPRLAGVTGFFEKFSRARSSHCYRLNFFGQEVP